MLLSSPILSKYYLSGAQSPALLSWDKRLCYVFMAHVRIIKTPQVLYFEVHTGPLWPMNGGGPGIHVHYHLMESIWHLCFLFCGQQLLAESRLLPLTVWFLVPWYYYISTDAYCTTEGGLSYFVEDLTGIRFRHYCPASGNGANQVWGNITDLMTGIKARMCIYTHTDNISDFYVSTTTLGSVTKCITIPWLVNMYISC